MNEQSRASAGFSETDIIFECPRCGKSLAIDERGAGLLVRCPDCGLRMQVPVPERMAESPASAGAPLGGDYTDADLARPGSTERASAAERVSYSDEDIHHRKQHLEKIRIDYLARFQRILEEMAAIQACLDRMTDLLQDMKMDSGAS